MQISGIFIHPIKAVRAVALDSAQVEPRGLAGDRRWLIVDSEHQFVTQRKHPILATVIAEATPLGLNLRHGSMSPASIPFPDQGPTLRVTVWKNQVDAHDAGDIAADWVSRVLGFPVRLVWMGPKSIRSIDPSFGLPGDEVSFADGFPLLLTNEASLADLNAKMGSVLPMSRFRTNVVVTGAPPWAEHDWKALTIGSVEFRNVKPCARCIVTTTDQTTGERMGEEPLRTLATFGRVEGQAIFGTNLIPSGVGTIRVGDTVTPTS